jgi:hypothetical protein
MYLMAVADIRRVLLHRQTLAQITAGCDFGAGTMTLAWWAAGRQHVAKAFHAVVGWSTTSCHSQAEKVLMRVCVVMYMASRGAAAVCSSHCRCVVGRPGTH